MSSVLFCGYGWASRVLWQPALAVAGFDDVGAFDQHVASADAAEAGVRRVHREMSEIGVGRYDLAVVASPNRSHADLAVALLERGVPTVIEKPVCLRVQDVHRLRAASERGGAALLRSRSTHYDAHVQAFVAEARAAVPDARRIAASWIRADGLPRSPWLTQVQHAGAGSSLDLGWHLLECVLELSGDDPLTLREASFTGHDGDITAGRADWHGLARPGVATAVQIDVDVAATLRFGGVRDVVVETAWRSARGGDQVVLEASADGGMRTRLTTLLGMSVAESGEPRLETTTPQGAVRLPLPVRARGAAHSQMVAEYARADFDPASLGQTWEQLEILAGAAESVEQWHARWRPGQD